MTKIQLACLEVPGFEALYQKFIRRMSIIDRAKSTCSNYGRNLAAIALHYKSLPTSLTLDEIEDYLFIVKEKSVNRSLNAIKFTICVLKFVFRMEGLDELRIKLPVIRIRRKLPVVLSKEEITAMMNIPVQLKHRVMIALLYGCGLRCGEVRNLRVSDIDFDRVVLHVRQGKGKKDRYLPLGDTLPGILRKYLKIQKPKEWLFPGGCRERHNNSFFTEFDKQNGQRSIQWAIKRAAGFAGISKNVTTHSLRHTYATHLLEDGVDILTIKELMGHAYISTTMIYLHVAQVKSKNKCSPLDKLQGLHIIPAVQGELFSMD